MKKLIVTALLAVFGLSAQAQIVTSRTSMIYKEKSLRTFMWTARLNYSADSWSGDSDVKGATGFNAGLGFTDYLGKERNGIFWGFEAVGMTNSANYDITDSNVFVFGVYGAPRIGYKIPIVDKIAISPYVGAYVGFMFEGDTDNSFWGWNTWEENKSGKRIKHDYRAWGTDKFEAGESVSYGINVGVELFLTDHFFIDLHVSKSLSEDGETVRRSYSSEQISELDSYGNYVNSTYYYDHAKNYEIKEKLSAFKLSLGVGFQF